MPIQFPLARRDNVFNDLSSLYKKPFAIVPAPNLGRPGVPVSASTLSPGGTWPKKHPNVQRLGTDYADVSRTAVINPVNTRFTDRLVYDRVLSLAQWRLTGISRDNTGAVLENCQVLVFRTNDKVLEIETLSDGSGNWTVLVSQPRAYFFVEYKAGSPDVFGTSLNTREPVQI